MPAWAKYKFCSVLCKRTLLVIKPGCIAMLHVQGSWWKAPDGWQGIVADKEIMDCWEDSSEGCKPCMK